VEEDSTVFHASDVVISGNIIGGSSDGSALGASSPQITISDNIFHGDHKNAIKLGKGSGQGDEVSIEGNVLKKPSGATNDSFNGILVDDPAHSEINISGNTITGYNIGIELLGSETHEIHIGNNTISDVGLSAINLNLNDIQFYGNHILRTGSNSINISASGFDIRNNRVEDSGGTGIRQEGTAGGGEIRGNEVTGSADQGVTVQTGEVVIDGNRLEKNGARGLTVLGGSGHVIVDNRIKNNDQNANGADEVRLGATGCEVRGNVVLARNGSTSFNEYNGNDNRWIANKAPDDGSAWLNLGPQSVLANNTPSVDTHRGLSDGDSDNSISVTFEKAYASRPKLEFGRVGGGIDGVSFTTDGSGNYDGATISIGTAGGTIDVFVESAV